jgi:hypothetical protein
VAVITSAGEVSADLIGLRGAERGVEGEGFVPVVTGLASVAGRLAGAGQAVVGACQLVFLAVAGCAAERGGVLSASIGRPPGGEQRVAETIERSDFTGLVANLTAHSQGLPLVIRGLLIPALPQVGSAQNDEGMNFASPVTALAEHGQGLAEVADGLPEIALPHADLAQVAKSVSFPGPVACLAEDSQTAVVALDGLLITALLKVDHAQGDQHMGFTGLITDFAPQGQGLLEMSAGLLVLTKLEVENA